MLLTHCLLTVLLFGVISSSFVRDLTSKQEAKARLYDDLTNHTVVRNRLSPEAVDGTVSVNCRFWLNKVIEVVEAKQTLTTMICIWIGWRQPDLAWNSNDYASLTRASLPVSLIWAPELLLLNMAQDQKANLGDEQSVTLLNNGTVSLLVSHVITTHCNYDVTFYPFDSQTCMIYLSIGGNDVFLKIETVEFQDSIFPEESEYLKGEWTIVSKSVRHFFIEKTETEAVEITLTMKRAFLFYILCVLLPMIVTSIITLMVFWIPPGSGEKMSFLVTIYVSTSLLLSIVSDTLPRNIFASEKIPRMALLVVFVVTQCIVAVIATIFVMHRYEEEQQLRQEACGQSSVADIKKEISGKSLDIEEESNKESDVSFGSKVSLIKEKMNKKMLAFVNPFKNLNITDHKMTAKTLDRIFFIILLFVCSVFYILVFSI